MLAEVPAFARTTWLLMAAALTLLVAAPAAAQDFPKLTGRVVDQADLLRPEQELDLTSKLAALESQSGRQFVVATVKSLDGYEISDYATKLGRAWKIGDEQKFSSPVGGCPQFGLNLKTVHVR